MRWLPRKNLTPKNESTKGSQVQHGGQRMEHDGAIPDGWYHAILYMYIYICTLCSLMYTVYCIYSKHICRYVYKVYLYIYIISIYQSYTVIRV